MSSVTEHDLDRAVERQRRWIEEKLLVERVRVHVEAARKRAGGAWVARLEISPGNFACLFKSGGV